LLRNYGYSIIEFVDISKLARVIDGKTLKELFTYYSIVESQTIILGHRSSNTEICIAIQKQEAHR